MPSALLLRSLPPFVLAASLTIVASPFAAATPAGRYADPAPIGQPAAPTPGTSLDRPRFSIDATIQVGDDGSPEVRVDYRLNRGELLFERRADGYAASYEVRVIFYSSKGHRQVAGDSFTRGLRAATYAATRTVGEDIVDHVEFRVPPGKYAMEVTVTDLTAERPSTTAVDIEVPKQPTGQVWFSDLSLGTVNAKPSGSTLRDRLLANPSRRFGEEILSFGAYGEIVDRRTSGADSTYRVRYRVADDSDQTAAKGDTVVARSGARTPFLLRPYLGGLSPGSYRFVVELEVAAPPGKSHGKPEVVRRDKRFEVAQSKVSVGPDARSSLDVLRYIAKPAEAAEMNRLQTDEERQAYWEAFWSRRDPSPDTPENEARDEFYQRVQYANQHFGVGEAGWKTDMGRIYITYGRPDEVVRNPFNFDRPPEEIWYYFQEQQTFVFVDKDGFGRYELTRSGAR
jgi:GWxTD domain-containing protein